MLPECEEKMGIVTSRVSLILNYRKITFFKKFAANFGLIFSSLSKWPMLLTWLKVLAMSSSWVNKSSRHSPMLNINNPRNNIYCEESTVTAKVDKTPVKLKSGTKSEKIVLIFWHRMLIQGVWWNDLRKIQGGRLYYLCTCYRGCLCRWSPGVHIKLS